MINIVSTVCQDNKKRLADIPENSSFTGCIGNIPEYCGVFIKNILGVSMLGRSEIPGWINPYGNIVVHDYKPADLEITVKTKGE